MCHAPINYNEFVTKALLTPYNYCQLFNQKKIDNLSIN